MPDFPAIPKIRPCFSFVSVSKALWVFFVFICCDLSLSFVGQRIEGSRPRVRLEVSVDTKRTTVKNEGPTPVKEEKTSEPSSTKKRKKKQSKHKKQSKNIVPVETHWLVDTDEFVLVNTTDWDADQSFNNKLPTLPSLVKFTVRGNPLPLRRHRTSRGFVYNPSAKTQESFRNAVKRLVYPTLDNSFDAAPLWGANHTLAATILFRMKRPKAHFVSSKPGPDRLRATAPRETCSMLRTDVDNLAKFVLDSLNGVLYDDDRQITSLHVTKLYDNDTDQLCRGSTCICLRLLTDDDIPHLLESSFSLYP